MNNGSATTKSSTLSSQLNKAKMNQALLALAKLSPEKRAEIILNEAKKRGLTSA